MSQNYQRYQVILTEASPELSVAGKKAFGKCVLEARGEAGKVSLSVQNLKPGAICNAYIVSSDNLTSSAISIGRVIANNSGSAEIKWECNAKDVDDSGLELRAFNVAGLMILDDNTEKAPILGFKDKEVAWRNNLRIHSKKPLTMERVEAVTTPIEPPPEQAPLQNTETIPPVQNQQDDTPPVTLAKTPSFLEESVQLPPIPEPPPPEEFFETVEEGPAEKAFKDVASKINEKLNEINTLSLEGTYKIESPLDTLSLAGPDLHYLRNIFQSYSKIRPFKSCEDNMQWVRITPNELGLLPEEFRSLHSDHLVGAAYKKYNHLILGHKNQDEHIHITFGMPDIYAESNVASASISGLTEFKCCDCEGELEGKHGYWLKTVKYLDNENTVL